MDKPKDGQTFYDWLYIMCPIHGKTRRQKQTGYCVKCAVARDIQSRILRG